MSPTRLVLPGAALSVGEVLVPASLARHARVARVATGEAIELLDLAGTVAVGHLVAWEGATCRVAIEVLERERGEPPAPLVLGLAVLHTQAFDWAVEKATELGVTTLVPVLCERVQGGAHDRRVERWQRIAVAAVAQCGRSRVPRVEAPCQLAALLAEARGIRLVADPGAPPSDVERPGSDGVTVLVGPEGGFTASELSAISAEGFVGLRLGPRVLRAETAAVAALAVAQARLGWLEWPGDWDQGTGDSPHPPGHA
jgi:16S rRNA (uracil1498-N3)-methyltransferase